MGGETFASYMLGEKDWLKKMEIMYYLKKKTGIFYDNTVVFKTLITKLFLDYLHENYPEENIDDNLVITARLLCDCMKKENATDLDDIRSYAKRGAEYSKYDFASHLLIIIFEVVLNCISFVSVYNTSLTP